MRRKHLFTSLLMILVMAVTLLPVFDVPVKADGASISVQYKFTEITENFQVGNTYLYICDSSGVRIDTSSCLLALPQGSGSLKVVSGNNNGSRGYMSRYSGTTHLVDVSVITSATGFDGCRSGGIGRTGAGRTTYFCNAGGCQNAIGHAYTYETTTVTKDSISAVVREGVTIRSDGPQTLSTSDIILVAEINGETFEVPSNVFSLTDNQIDLSKEPQDNTVTAYFGGLSVECKVHFHSWSYTQGASANQVYAICADNECINNTVPATFSIDTPSNCVYNNTVKQVFINRGPGFPKTLTDNDITYYIADGTTKTNTENSGSAGVGKAPSKEGTYIAKATLEGVNMSVQFEIGKVKVSPSAVTKNGFTVNWTYMGADFKYLLDISEKENFSPCLANYNGFQIPDPEAESMVISDLEKGKTYYARVRLVNKSDGSPVATSDVITAEPSDHLHTWDLTVEDKTITAKCLKKDDFNCPALNSPIQFKLDVDESKPANGNFITVDITGEESAKEVAPAHTVLYFGTEDTVYGGTKGTTQKPTAPGTYKATLVVYRTKNPVDIDETDSLKKPATTSVGFEIYDDGGVKKVKEKYVYRYPGKGINRGGGFIDYTPREDILNYAFNSATNEQVDDIYINMTKEKLVSAFAYDCYTTDGGKKWVKGKLDDAKLAKAFGRRSNIRLSDKYDEKTKKPAEGATQYYFNTINKRPAATTLKPDYQLYMDPYGITNGQWTLLKVTTEVNLYQYYEIGIGSGKKLGKQGFGIWPDAGGVWVPDLTKAGKATKELYFYRTRATVDTPASKTKKVKISSVLAPTKFKADYKKELLKLKKGASLYLGESIPDLYEMEYDFEGNPYLGTETTQADMDGKFLKAATDEQAKGINLANYLTENRNIIHSWVNATGSKPATKVQQIVLAARGVINAEKNLKCSKGSIVLDKGKDMNYEFYDETAQKWIATVPAVTGDARIRARVKCNVKGGKENGKNYATGIEGVLDIKWGVYDTKDNKEGIVSATLKPSN